MPPEDKWKIIWENDNLDDTVLRARKEEHAEILARAQKIKKGEDDRVKEIIQLTDYR